MRNRKIKLSEPLLVRALQEKHEMGAKALYDMYSASLFGVICRIVPEQQLAEDILQELFVKIWYSFDKYEPAKGRLFTWMVNMARNLSIDHLRSKSYRKTQSQQEIDNSVHDLAESEQSFSRFDQQLIRNALAGLPKKQMQVLELIYFKGYKHTEVAEELQMPLGSVKTSCRAAIATLRQWYAAENYLLAS